MGFLQCLALLPKDASFSRPVKQLAATASFSAKSAPMISAQIAAESEGEFAIVGTSKQLQEVLVN